jgi:hypothetical protein
MENSKKAQEFKALREKLHSELKALKDYSLVSGIYIQNIVKKVDTQEEYDCVINSIKDAIVSADVFEYRKIQREKCKDLLICLLKTGKKFVLTSQISNETLSKIQLVLSKSQQPQLDQESAPPAGTGLTFVSMATQQQQDASKNTENHLSPK